jgi:hypothetical protein
VNGRPPGSPLLENHKHRRHDQREAQNIVPLDGRTQIENRENREHSQGDYFLDRLQLHGAEFVGADAIGGYLKTIFEKAMAQLMTMTLNSGTSRYFKCPYQANVMKMLEMVSNTIVVIVFYAASNGPVFSSEQLR